MKKTVTLFILGGFVAIVTAATAHVSLRYRLIQAGYDLGEKSEELRALEQQNRKLRLEASLLRSPERIERLARDRLGMVRPDPEHVRVVRVSDAKEMADARR
jgi:cell division protein FtsL